MSDIDEILAEMYPDSDPAKWPDELKQQIAEALNKGKVPEAENDNPIPPEDRAPIDTNKLIGDFRETLRRTRQSCGEGGCGPTPLPISRP